MLNALKTHFIIVTKRQIIQVIIKMKQWKSNMNNKENDNIE